MSEIPNYFSPLGSDDLYNSETGELVFSSKKTIWVDDQFDLIKQELYKQNAHRDLDNYRKLKKHVDDLVLSGREIIINTPPPPSPDFLPHVYYALQREKNFSISNYKDFDDFFQNYKYSSPTFSNTL